MKYLPIIICGSILFAVAPRATAEEKANAGIVTREIPLKEIWAYEMPGTRNIKELEPENFGERVRRLDSAQQIKREKDSLAFQIIEKLGSEGRGKIAAPGFVVMGEGLDALRAAHAVLVDKRKPKEAFSTRDKLSLIFFSKSLEYYVRLDKVEQQGNTFTIRYFFVPHRTPDESSHFALIPLQAPGAGDWNVEIVRSRLPVTPDVAGIAPADPALDSLIVCRPFKFLVDRAAMK